MATKRPAPSSSTTKQPWKRHKPSHSDRPNHGPKSFKKAHPINTLKSQIRSVTRLLSHTDLPATIRNEKERELATSQKALSRAQTAKRRNEMIGKFHKIRFFERQKAERRLKRARKEGLGEEEVERRMVDLNYAVNFPLEREYVSLWPKRRGEEAEVENEGEERQGDKEMWELVRKCMKEGTLKELREGRLEEKDVEEEQDEVPKPVSKTKKKEKSKKPKKEMEKVVIENGESEEESDNESGGGFFE